MKRISTILLALLFPISVLTAKNWCEILINNLNSKSHIDKTVAVSRAPDSHEITNATYSFRFKSNKLFRQIFNTVKCHAPESDYYSETGGNYGTIILRFSDKSKVWSCKLMSDKQSNQFLVTVRSGDSDDNAFMSVTELDDMRRNTENYNHAKQKSTKNTIRTRRQATGKTTTIVNEETDKHNAELTEHEQALRKAEAERKKRLGL